MTQKSVAKPTSKADVKKAVKATKKNMPITKKVASNAYPKNRTKKAADSGYMG